MKIIDKLVTKLFKAVSAEPERTLIKEQVNIAGTSYYLSNINKLSVSNKDYRSKPATIISNGDAGKKIYRYTYVNKPVKLEPEPTNPHDKNAIKILIAGELVGYVAASDCRHIKDVLENHDVKYISAFIGGGDYKVVSLNGDVVKWSEHIHVSVRIAYV